MRSPTRSRASDMADLCDELGDLLLQAVYHARMADEAGRSRFRRRGRGDHHQADPAPPACLRRRRRARRRRRQGLLGKGQGQGEGRTGRRAAARRPAGLLDGVPARPAGAHARAHKLQAKAVDRRLRLERCRAWCSPSSGRRSARSRPSSTRTDPEQRRRCRRGRRPALRRGQSRPPPEGGSRPGAARAPTSSSSAASRAIEAALARRGPHARPRPASTRWKRSGRRAKQAE